MDAVLVVVEEIGPKVAREGTQLGDQGAGEGAPPTLFEDGPLDAFDRAIGLRAAGMDEAMLGGEEGSPGAEGLRTELGAVIGGDALEWPAS